MPGEPKTGRGRASRERIVERAAELFAARGIAATSLDEVLAAAGAGKGQFYHYFRGRDELAAAAVGFRCARVVSGLTEALGAVSSLAELEQALAGYAAGFEQSGMPGCPIGTLASEVAGRNEDARLRAAAGFDAWERLLAQALERMRQRGELRADAEPGRLATGLLASLEGGMVLSQARKDIASLRVAIEAGLSPVRAWASLSLELATSQGGAAAGGAIVVADEQAAAADARREPGRPRRPRRRPGRPGRRAVLTGAALGLAVAVVYGCALREASAVTTESDAASFALQGWAMTHGNPLLQGWRLADVSFYTVDLPVYAVGVLVAGLRPAVVAGCAAAVFTILVVLAAVVARGRSRGLAGALAVALTVAIMAGPVAPAAGVLLAMPDHTGTAVVPLALALVIDRARPGWRAAALVCVVLAWGLLADALVLLIGVVPVVVVCLARALRAQVSQDRAARSELYLAAGGVASVVLYALVKVAIRLAGGWELDGSGHQFVQGRDLAGNVGGTLQVLLSLFSASPFGRPASGAGLILIAVHLALFCLVAIAGWMALRRLAWTGDLVAVLLAAGIVANLAAYTVLYLTGPGTGQDVAPVFGMGAALAGRVLGGPLARAWHARAIPEDPVTPERGPRAGPLLAAWAAIVVAISVPPLVTARPAAPDNAALAAWLEGHGLHSGIAHYWQANSITLDTRGAVTIRDVRDYGPRGGIRPYPWEEDTSLLDPRRDYADFVIAAAHSGLTVPAIEQRFGFPARVFHVGTFTVLAYDRNLLPDLAGLPAPWPSRVGL